MRHHAALTAPSNPPYLRTAHCRSRPWTRSSCRASSLPRTSRSTSCSRRSPSRSAGCCCSSSCATTPTGDGAWMRAYFTWVKVFALSFALGVVSGVTMSFQFGTNWPGYMAEGRQHRRAAAGLRDPHRLLPRGGVPRHHAVRLPPRLQPRPHAGHLPRRLRHDDVGLLDPGAELLDADAGRLRDARRRRPCRRLVGGDLQPVLPLSPDPHAARLGADGLVPDRRPVGAALSRRRPLGIDVEGAAHRRLHAPPS